MWRRLSGSKGQSLKLPVHKRSEVSEKVFSGVVLRLGHRPSGVT
jgi:hypothetical protein